MNTSRFPRFAIPAIVVISLLVFSKPGFGQDKQDQKAVLKTMIDSRQFFFTANSATTMKGRTIQLTGGGYDLILFKDTLIVNLPYYGRAYASSYPAANDMGVNFTSVDFTYKVDTVKKGGWSITIKPKRESKASSIYLSVSTGGYCTVRINGGNRDPISYYGTVTPLKAH